MALGAIISAGVGLAKLGVGIAQRRKGKKLEEATERPDYEIPAEVFQNLSQAQQMALQGLPAEQKAQYLQNLQQSGQFALSQSGSRKAGLTGIGQMQQQQGYGLQSLLAQDSAARQQNQMQVMQQRQNVAGYRDQAFQLNQLNPFYEDIAQARGLQSAGMQNMFTGMENTAYNIGQLEQETKDTGKKLLGMGMGGGVGSVAGKTLGGIMGIGGQVGGTAGGFANTQQKTPSSSNQYSLSPVKFNY